MKDKQIWLISLLFLLLTSSFLLIFSQTENKPSINFPETIAASKQSPQYIKIGSGIASYFYLLNIYSGALYLPASPLINMASEQKNIDIKALLNGQSANRLVLKLLTDRVSIDKNREFFTGILHDIYQEPLLSQNLSALDKFLEHKIQSGDEVVFDYQPALGTKLYINEQLMAEIKGAKFQQQLLNLWIGEQAISPLFKHQLLSLD